MKLVIDIPKYIYEHAKKQSEDSYDKWVAMRTIANGIPLPKGHGRIIDESKINKCGWNFVNHHAKTDAPTIIEGSESE